MPDRNLYLSNVPVGEALRRFMNALELHMGRKSEKIRVTDSLGRVTAEAVYAKYNSPLYDSAAMDGIAVVSGRTKGAGESAPLVLKNNADFIQVDTGDPVKPPYDAVIMAEDIVETGEGDAVIRSAAAAWQHIRPVGEDIVSGEMILPGGHTIRPIDIGVLLSGGITEVLVVKRMEIAIFPTGDEMIEPGEIIKEGSIIESNSRMLEALVTQSGGAPKRFPSVPDDFGVLRERISEAARVYDMVLVCAGTSAGREDHTARVLNGIGEVIVHGVAMKPGKPVILAVVNGKPVAGIPGYPVSAYLAYESFIAPVISSYMGIPPANAPVVRAVLTRRLVSSLKHREYVRVKAGKVAGKFIATPLARGAGAAMSLVRADGFCVIGQDEEGVEAGEEVDVMLFRGLDKLENTVVSIGSHDLIMDVLADLMPRLNSGVFLSSTHVGSMGGLTALSNNEAHIAPIHLLDGDTGVYNKPFLEKLFKGRRMALIKGVGRVQGIMVKKGNPLSIKGIGDLQGIRFVNRQRGAGTRILLDYLLKSYGIDPSHIEGYRREAATHMAVAAAVRGESADAGLGILSAANVMDLDFIPVGEEDYDFAAPAEYLEIPHVRSFIETLMSADFQKELVELGGYTAEGIGEVSYVGG